MKRLNTKKMILVVVIFSIAMAMLESAVVIYLRAMLYPDGFNFPLSTLNLGLAAVEISREFATLVMLVAVGLMAGHNTNTKWAYFLMSFAIWDIFYYVFLWVFLDWPASIQTWDVLFLIPVMWVGPVWTPILLALTMIALALVLLRVNSHGNTPIGNNWRWLILGAITCIVSFCWDSVKFLSTIPDVKWYDANAIFDSNYVPSNFPYWIFLLGFAFIVIGMARYYHQNVYSTFRLNRTQML